jgi:hypothetical protein
MVITGVGLLDCIVTSSNSVAAIDEHRPIMRSLVSGYDVHLRHLPDSVYYLNYNLCYDIFILIT